MKSLYLNILPVLVTVLAIIISEVRIGEVLVTVVLGSKICLSVCVSLLKNEDKF